MYRLLNELIRSRKDILKNMKLNVDISADYDDEPEVIIRCRSHNSQVQALEDILSKVHKKINVYCDGKAYVMEPRKILYFESVDGIVYVYDRDRVYTSSFTLNDIESEFNELGFFRCSKSIVVNIYAIDNLKSELGNRIDAQLTNGEHVIISRRYASTFRKVLKEACK